LSIEEAKQITSTFAGKPFVAPPRTIADITAILDQYQPDPTLAEKALALADQSVPNTTDAGTLAKFYYERAFAAERIGRNDQAIQDNTTAIGYAQQVGDTDIAIILNALARVEALAGMYSASIAHRQEAITKSSRPTVSWHSVQARIYADHGKLDEAQQELDRAQNALVEAGAERQQTYYKWWTGNLQQARGRIALDTGKYAEAETALRMSFHNYLEGGQSVDPPGQYINYENATKDLSRTLAEDGRPVEAEIEARKALISILEKRGRYAVDTAWVLEALTTAIYAQGRYREAEQLARAGVDIYHTVGVIPASLTLARTRMQLVSALVGQQRWQEALKEFENLRHDLAPDPAGLQALFQHNVDWPLVLTMAGRNREATEAAQAVVTQCQKDYGEQHYQTAIARGMLALSLARAGDRSRALAEFAAAVPALLNAARQTEGGDAASGARYQRVLLILEAYIELLTDIRGTELERSAGVEVVVETFRLADALRSQTIQRVLGQSGARAAATNGELADLVRRQQDSQQQIQALYGLLSNILALPAAQQDQQALAQLRAQLSPLEVAHQRLVDEITRNFPYYVQLVAPQPATLEQVQARLRDGEALVALYVTSTRTLVWGVPRHGQIAFAVVPLGTEQVEQRVSNLRHALDPQVTTLGEIPEFDLATSYQLYHRLLQPVESAWNDATTLFVVAHGALAQLPFGLLPTGAVSLKPEIAALFSHYRAVPWLIRRVAIAQLPSAATLLNLRGLPPGRADRQPFAGFGDPYFSLAQAEAAKGEDGAKIAGRPTASSLVVSRGRALELRSQPQIDGMQSMVLAQLPRLPETATELRSIAAALKADPEQDVFLGKRASVRVVRTLDLANRRILAFATHGLVPGDLNGLVQPALALSAPEVTGTDDDGLLTMNAILGLRLDADWVVLSACNTAAGHQAGGEALSGLGRAFFYAGARSLLVSHWPVETTSAKALTTELFRHQAQNPALTKAQALRDTMLGLIVGPGYIDPSANKTVFSYAHPIFWAPFSLIGIP
jgi:CHAT domain-containing protein